MNQQVIKPAFPLPTTKEELVSRKTMLAQPTLNDHVDNIHLQLWAEDDYRSLLDAVSDEDAVEGSCAIDNYKAAERIREYGRRHDNTYVAKKKLATIVKALNVVLRRYHISRKERAQMIGGEIVPSE